MYIENHVERGESENVQIENNRVEENGEQIMKKCFAKIICLEKFLEKA
jgi:hypothetical protein